MHQPLQSATSAQPEFLTVSDYCNIDEVKKAFAPLATINEQTLPVSDQSIFFVIRTQGHDNIHRAMKYGLWTSSSRKNKRLSQAFQETQSKKAGVYLFFTKISSQRFSGVAQLVSDFDHQKHFKFWFEENKWFGLFQLKWIYVKDVPFTIFNELQQEQKLDGSLENMKKTFELIDCTELTNENGIKMMDIFCHSESTRSLLEDFKQIDIIEEQQRKERMKSHTFDLKFNELTKVFETIPFNFSISQYERKKMQKSQQNQFYQQQFYYNPYFLQQQYLAATQYGFQNNQPQTEWENNNGFYQRQTQSNQRENEHEEDPSEAQRGYVEPQRQRHQQQQFDEPIEKRFDVKQSKNKNLKNNKKNKQEVIQFVPKQEHSN